MEFKQLRHFVTIVDVGSFSGASEVLHITQPALTRSIKNLENQLQTDLLERRTRGVVPTEAGSRLYQQAKTILNEAAKTELDVAAAARGEMGTISVGVGAMFAGGPLAKVLAHLQDASPDIRVHAFEGFFEDLLEDLKSARIDAVLSNFPPGVVEEAIEYEPLIKIRSHFVAAASHPVANKSSLTMADLKDCKMAMVGQPHVSVLVAELFASEHLVLNTPAVETNSLSLLHALVLNHGYVSLLPDSYLADDETSGRIVRLPVDGTPFERSSGLFTRRGTVQRPALGRFLETARKTFSEWPGFKSA